jgi:hypothetical protein
MGSATLHVPGISWCRPPAGSRSQHGLARLLRHLDRRPRRGGMPPHWVWHLETTSQIAPVLAQGSAKSPLLSDGIHPEASSCRQQLRRVVSLDFHRACSNLPRRRRFSSQVQMSQHSSPRSKRVCSWGGMSKKGSAHDLARYPCRRDGGVGGGSSRGRDHGRLGRRDHQGGASGRRSHAAAVSGDRRTRFRDEPAVSSGQPRQA